MSVVEGTRSSRKNNSEKTNHRAANLYSPVAAPIPPLAPVMRTFLLNKRCVGKMVVMVGVGVVVAAGE